MNAEVEVSGIGSGGRVGYRGKDCRKGRGCTGRGARGIGSGIGSGIGAGIGSGTEVEGQERANNIGRA